jgi:hypothetical protein
VFALGIDIEDFTHIATALENGLKILSNCEKLRKKNKGEFLNYLKLSKFLHV